MRRVCCLAWLDVSRRSQGLSTEVSLMLNHPLDWHNETGEIRSNLVSRSRTNQVDFQ